VRLGAERADLKQALAELGPVTKKLEAAERAFDQASDDRAVAIEDAKKAAGQLEIARKEIQHLRGELREERRRTNLAASAKETVTEVPENLDAYMQRLQDERDELREKVRALDAAASRVPTAIAPRPLVRTPLTPYL
jgi:chromosome segregation ATPase